jgi:hypothetical protein
MSEVFAAALAALAVVGIPLVAWFSRRATREGRLLLRIERLGSVYSLMPASLEKNTFEVRVTEAVADLNRWLDEDNAKRRTIVRLISGATYAIGVVAVLIALPFLDAAANPLQSSLFGSVVGVAIAAVTTGASFVLERSASAKSARAAKEREGAADALRIEALRQGHPLPIPQPANKRV